MIYLIDVASVNFQHEQFNNSIIKLLLNQHNSSEIKFFGEEDHLKIQKAKGVNIQFKEINVYNKRGKFHEFIRAFKQFINLRNIINEAGNNPNNKVIILLIHPFAHWMLKLFYKCPINTTVILHGELESLKFNKHFLNKIWGYFLLSAIQRVSNNLNYIILGKSIFNNLIQIIPEINDQRVLCLDHPYPFSEVIVKNRDLNSLVFASVGVATLSKYSQYFFEVAHDVKQKKQASLNSRFIICGKVNPDISSYLNKFVEYNIIGKGYTRNEIDFLLSQAHYCVFYYDNTNYSMCSSGAFWDAINAEIPLLYVYNDYFNYYANLVGGIGMGFDSVQDLNNYIINQHTENYYDINYDKYVENIRKLKFEVMNYEKLSSELNAFII